MRRAAALVSLFAASSLLGCAGNGGETGDIELDLTGADQAQLFSLTTSTTAQPQHTSKSDVVSVVVTINEIDAKVNGAWVPLVTAPQQIDLLKLDNKSVSTLGVVKIPTGHVSELRFAMDQIGDYVVLTSGDKKPLIVPDNGVVKVTGKLDLDSCAAGIVIFDFDPHVQIDEVPGHHIYTLACNAHIKTDEVKGTCSNGTGSDGGGGAGGGGAGGAGGGGGNNACTGVVCMMGQTCVVQNGAPVCMDTCTNVICAAPTVCVVENGTPTCVDPSTGNGGGGAGGGGGGNGGGGNGGGGGGSGGTGGSGGSGGGGGCHNGSH